MSRRLLILVGMTVAASCSAPRPADGPTERSGPVSDHDGPPPAMGARPQPTATGEQPTSGEPSNDAPPTIAELIAGWCASPMNRVQVLEDHAGKVGGYATSVNVRDSAISYHDADGVFLGRFSIFGDPQTTEKSPGSIERLQKAFPVFRPLPCDGQDG